MRTIRRRQGRATGSIMVAQSDRGGTQNSWQRPRRVGHVQSRYVALRALLEDDTLCLGRPGSTSRSVSSLDQSYCAVLNVSSVNFALRSAEEQEAIIASFSAWLNALSFDVQILVRVLPLSLEPYLRRPLRSLSALRAANAAAATTQVNALQAGDSAHGLGAGASGGDGQHTAATGASERLRARDAWIELIADHVQFVRELARQRRLLDRHFYLIIPADSGQREREGGGHLRRLADLGRSVRALRRPRFPRHQEKTDQPDFLDAAARTWQQQNAARHQLDLRVREVTRQLGRIGLSAHRLRGRELVQLYYSCLTPQRAARHPLSEQVLASAGVPVVAGAVCEGQVLNLL